MSEFFNKETQDSAFLNKLVGYQRAEFTRAARRQSSIFLIQILIAIGSSVAVFLPDGKITYVATIASMILSVGYTVATVSYKGTRSLSERLRRATLLAQGMGLSISDSEWRSIMVRLKSKSSEASALTDSEYYGSQTPLSAQRLTEMLEESAFWSGHLHRSSASVMWIAFAMSILLFFIFLFFAIPSMSSQNLLNGARVVSIMLVLVVSNDVFVAALDHTAAANALQDIITRLEAVKLSGYLEPNVLFVLGEYNAAVQEAPMMVPFVYDANKDKINELWRRK